MTQLISATRSEARTITVVCIGVPEDAQQALRRRLAASPSDTRWDLVVATDQPSQVRPDLVLCGAASASTAAVRRWPAAPVIALVDVRSDGIGTLEPAGATCVRADDLGLVAAYLWAVARLRGLLGQDVPRRDRPGSLAGPDGARRTLHGHRVLDRRPWRG